MISEEKLLKENFKKEVFFYSIGGGEDESDITIFRKEDTVIYKDPYFGNWHKADWNDFDYKNGYPSGAIIKDI